MLGDSRMSHPYEGEPCSQPPPSQVPLTNPLAVPLLEELAGIGARHHPDLSQPPRAPAFPAASAGQVGAPHRCCSL